MNTFCCLPWIHLATHPDGGTTLCCISDHRNGASRARNFDPTTFLNLNSTRINDLINSDYNRKVRLEMLSGRIPDACQRCFFEESKNIRSKRTEENNKFNFTEDMARAITSADGNIPVNFKFIELRLGNLCNLTCRTCNPNSSTKWIQPYQKLQRELQFVTNYERKINCTWIESDSFWEDLFNHSSDVELIYVNGGEPTLAEKHWKYLEELIKRGLNEKITLWYNINLTNLPDKLINLWKAFKKVQVTCSIDDLYERNEYIRVGSNWNEVLKNLDKLQSLSWIESSVCQTISWINVYNINEFISFMENRNLHVHMNFVYDPEFLSIKILPEQLHGLILDRCSDLNEWQRNSISSKLLKFDYELFHQGIKYTNFLDNYHSKYFKEVYPDWYNELKRYINVGSV